LLHDARALRREGRLEAAERTTRRALELLPESSASSGAATPQLLASIHRLRGELLEELDRDAEAREHYAKADALAPPSPPLPDGGLDAATERLLVVLLPPPADQTDLGRAPTAALDNPVHAALAERVRTRLPRAELRPAPDPSSTTVPSLRQWLDSTGRSVAMSVRVDRAYCSESNKDGRFGIARLRVAIAWRGVGPDPQNASREHRLVHVENDAALGADCPLQSAQRALELAFELEELRRALRIEPSAERGEWRRLGIHRLFPELDERIELRLEEGRRELALGQLLEAREAFVEASKIDPDHMDTRSFLGEVDLTLELSRQLARKRSDGVAGRDDAPWTELEPQLSPAQHRALEAQLEHERTLRDQLLLTLEALGAGDDLPDAATLAALRPGEITDPTARGPSRARAHQQREGTTEPGPAGESAELTTRMLYGPSGELIARYYFDDGREAPLLKEEDSSGDGKLDRWIAYHEGTRKEVWEEGRGGGLPNLHVVYADDARSVERIELDESQDGWPERLFIYRDGQLRSESRDTKGDGRYDEIEHFDDDGRLALREQDLDHDGVIDVRTTYRAGRIVRREIMNPEIVDRIQ
jgi:tetratricopeptide (TPR) repeat protein